MKDCNKKAWLCYHVDQCEMGSEGHSSMMYPMVCYGDTDEYSSMMYPMVCYGDTDEEILADYRSNLKSVFGKDIIGEVTYGKDGTVYSYYPIHKVFLPRDVYGDNIDVLKIKEGEFKKEEHIPDEIRDIILKFKSKISQPSEKLFCIEIESTTYRNFGTSIIVKAGSINHAYVTFWNQILNDDSIDISDDWAEPLFENDDISNWVIDSSDDKSITYSSKYRGKDFIIRVKELDMSKGYALI